VGDDRQKGTQRFEADKKDDITRSVAAWNQKADSNEKGKLGAKVIFILGYSLFCFVFD
jgi:hypothetical protein